MNWQYVCENSFEHDHKGLDVCPVCGGDVVRVEL